MPHSLYHCCWCNSRMDASFIISALQLSSLSLCEVQACNVTEFPLAQMSFSRPLMVNVVSLFFRDSKFCFL